MSLETTHTFAGRHYETGTIANWLQASGHDISESLVFGASGGIAFGYFVFEYTGHLPHVALLLRNTFSPFERALDNLGVRRTVKETIDPKKGLENLRMELDFGQPVIVWADAFSASWTNLPTGGMWSMNPLLVLRSVGSGFEVVDSCARPFFVEADELQALRSVVKKDRYRICVFDGIDHDRWVAGLLDGIKACCRLFLDKPPAGSTKNFGFCGMQHFMNALRDNKTALGWGKKFAGNEKFIQGAFGTFGQPGIWDWIEQWGTAPGANRSTYACFLRLASPVLKLDFGEVAQALDHSSQLWREVAAAAMPDLIQAITKLRETKQQVANLRWEDPVGTLAARAALRDELRSIIASMPDLTEVSLSIRAEVADRMEQVLAVEQGAISQLREIVS